MKAWWRVGSSGFRKCPGYLFEARYLANPSGSGTPAARAKASQARTMLSRLVTTVSKTCYWISSVVE
jgi:hypothetical protein